MDSGSSDWRSCGRPPCFFHLPFASVRPVWLAVVLLPNSLHGGGEVVEMEEELREKGESSVTTKQPARIWPASQTTWSQNHHDIGT